jgi:hypothetical protein
MRKDGGRRKKIKGKWPHPPKKKERVGQTLGQGGTKWHKKRASD